MNDEELLLSIKQTTELLDKLHKEWVQRNSYSVDTAEIGKENLQCVGEQFTCEMYIDNNYIVPSVVWNLN